MTGVASPRVSAATVPPSGPPAQSGRRGWADDPRLRNWVFACTALAVVLRLFRLGAQSYWLDEGLQTVLVGYRSPSELLDAVRAGIDKSPPLYHFVSWFWSRLGSTSETWMRLPSVLFAASSVPAVALVARRVACRSVALAALLAAIAPISVYYGQEARMYALALALSAWSMVAFLRGRSTEERWPWVAWMALRLAAAYTHPYTIFLCLPEAVVAWRTSAGVRRRFVVAGTALVIGYLPWLLVLFSLRNAAAGLPKDLSPLAVGYGLFALIFGLSLGPSVASLHRSASLGPQHLSVIAVCVVVLVPLAVAWARRGSERLLMAAWVASPMLGAFALGLATNVTFNVRYAIGGLPALLVALADGVTVLGRGPRRIVGSALVVLLTISVFNWFTNPYYAKEDYRRATATVVRGYSPGDQVLLLAHDDTFRHYSQGRLPYTRLYGDRGLDRIAWDALRAQGLKPGTVWIVRVRPWEADPDGSVLRALEAQGEVVATYEFVGAEVVKIEVSSPH